MNAGTPPAPPSQPPSEPPQQPRSPRTGLTLDAHTVGIAIAFLTALAGLLTALLNNGTTVVQQSPNTGKITQTTATGTKIAVPKSALAKAQQSDLGQHVQLGPGVDTQATAKADNAAASPAAPKVIGPPPLASPHQAGCTTRQNSSNYSYRLGIKPSLIVLHLTVSPNVPGWSDVNGVWGFLNSPSTQASANYIVDSEGHCIYAVPETEKAWAQVSFNSASACAIEVINYGNLGHESSYTAGAGLHQLGRMVHDCAQRWHIPLREGRVRGCTVVRSGVIDHDHLGSCGGGHNDITPYAAGCRRRSGGESVNTWPCVDTVIAAARAGSKPPPSAHAKALCREYAHYKREVRAHTFPESKRPRAVAVRIALKKHGYSCSLSGNAVRR